MTEQQHYLSLDFEAVDLYGEKWIAVAVVVFNYPDRKKKMQFSTYLRRSDFDFNVQQRRFWKKHKAAFDYIMSRGSYDYISEELSLAVFIRTAHNVFPKLKIICDNPAYDIGILNNILKRQMDHLPVTYRSNGTSYVRIRDISMYVSKFEPTNEDIKAYLPTDHPLLPHTPLYDVLRACLSFFNYLDFVNEKKKVKQEQKKEKQEPKKLKQEQKKEKQDPKKEKQENDE